MDTMNAYGSALTHKRSLPDFVNNDRPESQMSPRISLARKRIGGLRIAVSVALPTYR
jgi:hypothetical protein